MVRRKWWLWLDGLLLLLTVYYYLPDLTGESRERLLSPDYWRARWRSEHLITPAGVLWRGDPHQPVVALTFDDGPDPNTTPAFWKSCAKRVFGRLFRGGHQTQALS